MEKIGTPARYMAIAAPDRIECVPISKQWMPNFVSPIATTPSRRRLVTISDVILIVLFLCLAREMSESLLVPLIERIRVTMEAQSLTGHMIGSDVLHFRFPVVFLSFESDRDAVCEMQHGRCVGQKIAVFDENDIPKAELFCLTLLCL
jgi:hypothetical protein